MKRLFISFLAILLVLSFVGCASGTSLFASVSPTPTEEPTPSPSPTPEPTPTLSPEEQQKRENAKNLIILMFSAKLGKYYKGYTFHEDTNTLELKVEIPGAREECYNSDKSKWEELCDIQMEMTKTFSLDEMKFDVMISILNDDPQAGDPAILYSTVNGYTTYDAGGLNKNMMPEK